MTRHTSRQIERAGHGHPAADRIILDYEGRFLRRKTLRTTSGDSLFVDLPETLSLNHDDAFLTTDGLRIAVDAAAEPLIEITAPGPDLSRLAWHIGNRHMPAQIEPHRILIQSNHVMADMLAHLGAATRDVREPFTPEGGAYGLGRTHGHHHGAATDDPDHHHDHGHDHDHAHDHAHAHAHPHSHD